jgi:hypothetical protein
MVQNRDILVEGCTNISKLYVGHWEPLGVSESCRTRIPGWPNPTDNRINAVAFRCTGEHLGALTTSLGALATNLGARRVTVEQSGKTLSSLGMLQFGWKS